MDQLRPPAVAGLFYPGQADELSVTVSGLISDARSAAERRVPKVLIAPHAGYVYSGPIAASAYATVASLRETVKRVALFGPAHRAWVRGLALPAADAFLTPLGTVPLDTEAMREAARLPQVVVSDAVHEHEHAIEVQLPFLQAMFGEFSLTPFAVGDASAREVTEVIDLLWGDRDTLIVVSSDLSHYLPYPRACAIDEFTARTILNLKPDLTHDQACGATPINGLLMAAGRRGLRPELLDLRNSGDTAGDKSRVVGYAAFAFYEPAAL